MDKMWVHLLRELNDRLFVKPDTPGNWHLLSGRSAGGPEVAEILGKKTLLRSVSPRFFPKPLAMWVAPGGSRRVVIKEDGLILLPKVAVLVHEAVCAVVPRG